MSSPALPPATPGTKATYLIRRRPETTRDQLVAHWFSHHMPAVVAGQTGAREKGRMHAFRYMASLFDPSEDGSTPWDGMAQLWWTDTPPRPSEPFGTVPADSFQERAETYVPWLMREYVIVDDDGRLPIPALTLNPAFPTTRSGFTKRVIFVKAREGVSHEQITEQWLTVHAPNIASSFAAAGGIRYVVDISTEPEVDGWNGMAELWFDSPEGWDRLAGSVAPDGFHRYADVVSAEHFVARTEMIGIA